MKSIIKISLSLYAIFLFTLLAAFFFSCSKDDAGLEAKQQLLLSTATINVIRGKEVSFQVSVAGHDITDAQIYVEDILIPSYTYIFPEIGMYHVIAKKENYEDSNLITIIVEKPRM